MSNQFVLPDILDVDKEIQRSILNSYNPNLLDHVISTQICISDDIVKEIHKVTTHSKTRDLYNYLIREEYKIANHVELVEYARAILKHIYCVILTNIPITQYKGQYIQMEQIAKNVSTDCVVVELHLSDRPKE